MSGKLTAAAVLTVIGLSILWIAFGSWIFMLLWNYVIANVFELPELNIYQSAGILMIITFIGNLIRK